MERPTLTNTETSLQSAEAAEMYLGKAIEIARAKFPNEQLSPEILAAVVNAITSDYNACAITDAIHELASKISEAGKDVRRGCEAIAKVIKEGTE